MSRFVHALSGIRSLPLAHYLKGLGVLRLVTEQKDPSARGAFRDDVFEIDTVLDRDALMRFFLEEVAPTPITSPWNGGSGYYPKDTRAGIAPIVASQGRRFVLYRSTVATSLELVRSFGLTESPKDEDKRRLVEACRATWQDDAVAWIDAATVLGEDRIVFPPLLGTGGNDGRLEFSINLMQRWLDLVDPDTDGPKPRARSWLDLALFDVNRAGLGEGSIGQFLPAAESGTNPWDFVLMLEGALFFASAAVRRLGGGDRGGASAPFTVRPVAVGYASEAEGEASRGEIWLPLWTAPASTRELRALFSEGRARVHGRDASDGVDFARALAGLGVDRGIDAFERIGFHVRNGLSYFATPLGRFEVRADARVALLDELDPWIQKVRQLVRSDAAPAGLRRAFREAERAALDITRGASPARMQRYLSAVARIEREIASRAKLVDDAKLGVRVLDPLDATWLDAIEDGSTELRLARSIVAATYTFRSHGRPLLDHLRRVRAAPNGRRRYDASDDPDYAFEGGGKLEARLASLVRRLGIVARSHGDGTWSLRSRAPVDLADVGAFVEGRIDDARLSDLVEALCLVDPHAIRRAPRTSDAPVPPVYACLALACYGERESHAIDDGEADGRDRVPAIAHRLPLVASMIERAGAGDGLVASELALRRLRASGYAPSIDSAPSVGAAVRRAAAALVFPLERGAVRRLERDLCRRASKTSNDTTQGDTRP